MKKVLLLVFEGAQSLDVSGPMDVFAEANQLLPQAYFELLLASPSGGAINCSNGMQIHTLGCLALPVEQIDYLLIAGGPSLPAQSIDSVTLSWIQQVAAEAACYGSVCNGAFVLGLAGLLDNKTVTTHWQDASALAMRFPNANVAADRIYVRDGRLVTSAGVTAGIDLSLALVAEQLGDALALQVAKRLVVFVQRQGGQSQFSPYWHYQGQPDSVLASIPSFVQQHLAQDLSVTQLAQHVGMSLRSFAREFALQFNVTPAEFVEQARLDAARHLLESSVMPLKTVAFHSGFNNAERMRKAFKRRFAISPQDYRQHFLRDK